MSAIDVKRKKDLAKIHIAKAQLDLDDDDYRDIISRVGGEKSAADLTEQGRQRVLAHFKRCGWQPKIKNNNKEIPIGRASKLQINVIRQYWTQLADYNVVRDFTEDGLRRWLQAQTRRYHPKRSGYSAPEWLPGDVASRVIEQLKNWCKRTDVPLIRTE